MIRDLLSVPLFWYTWYGVVGVGVTGRWLYQRSQENLAESVDWVNARNVHGAMATNEAPVLNPSTVVEGEVIDLQGNRIPEKPSWML